MTRRLHNLFFQVHRMIVARTAATRLTLSTVLVALLIGSPLVAGARNLEQINLPQLKQTVTVDALGHAECSLSIKFTTDVYNNFKSNNPNFAVLLRQWQLEPQWADISDVKGHFDDSATTLSITYRVNGLARMVRGGHWELQLPGDAGLQQVSVSDTSAVFSSIVSSEQLGNIVLFVNLNLPESSRNVQVLSTPQRVSYDADAVEGPQGERMAVDCALQVQPHVMSCLAKVYGNPKFAELWTARTTFRNQGDQPVFDYQVRFRINGYTLDWSAWKKTHEVRPGQTVVDPYFPELDLAKVATLTGQRSATVEIEYQYRRADGEVINEHASQTSQLLGRNDVVYSTMNYDSASNWYDLFDIGPYVVAAFVSHEDPIIQQVAGWVSQQAGGPSAASKDEDAMRFLRALYDFCRLNNIAYQTPPNGSAESQISQHIKFGRDVLRNRAGTCVDLSILYASVCEAVGLRPRVFLVPGHAFPVIPLPESGRWVSVETTLFCKASFDDAVAAGDKYRFDLRKNRVPYYPVDTMGMKARGVFGLELPELSTSALSDWGIKPIEPSAMATSPNSGAGAISMAQLQGAWVFSGEINGEKVQYGLAFNNDGTYACLVVSQLRNGQKYEKKEEGRFELAPGAIVFHRPNGVSTARSAELKNGQLLVAFTEIDRVLAFNRVQN